MVSSRLCRNWRLLGLLAVLGLGLALAACSSDEPSPAQPQPAAVQEQAQAEQPELQPQQEQQQQAAQPQPQSQAQIQEQEAEESAAQTQAQEDAEASPQQAEQEAQAEPEQAQVEQEQVEQEQVEQEQAAAQPYPAVPGIVDPGNSGWPREVEELNGIVSVPAKPLRIITASIGHDEVVLALAPNERLVAVGAVSKDATFSNIAEQVLDKPEVSRDPETIIVESPDIVVTSPWYPAEGIEALRSAGTLVIQTALGLDPQTQIDNILLIGYILGEEERAIAFAEEVRARLQVVIDATADKSERPGVISLTRYSDSLWTAGSGTTQGGLILAAGGVNAAAEAGIEGNQTTSLEGVIAMAPEVIIIPQPAAYGAEEFRQSLFENEVLAEVPAIRSGAVYIVESKYFSTLSHWNILGAEDLARILWPDDFPNAPAASFSAPE